VKSDFIGGKEPNINFGNTHE